MMLPPLDPGWENIKMEKEVCTSKFLTQQEVADRFRVTQSTILNWRRRGLLDYFQAPGSTRVLYPAEAVERFEQEHINKGKGGSKQPVVKRKRSEISAKPNKEWRI